MDIADDSYGAFEDGGTAHRRTGPGLVRTRRDGRREHCSGD